LTFSGVTSAGIVISSAFGGTSSGNSSLTRDKMREVLPTPGSPTSKILTLRRVIDDVEILAIDDDTILIVYLNFLQRKMTT